MVPEPIITFPGNVYSRRPQALVFLTKDKLELRSFNAVAIDERTEQK